MAIATAEAAAPAPAPTNVARARRLVWLAFGFQFAVYLGASWDRAWHATHPLEDFFSPPHLFIYAMVAACGLTILRMLATPEVREAFGAGVRLPVLGLEVPPALGLAAGGLALTGLSGFLDMIWHTTWGLDETAWSTPHAMLGWGFMLTPLGLICCRLQLRDRRRLSRITPALIALFALLLVPGVLLGPFDNNQSRDVVRAVSRLPVLAAEPDAQHTFRIYLQWNLTHAHGLFVPLSAAAVGVGLALARRLSQRTMIFLIAAVLATLFPLGGARRVAEYFGLGDDPANWLPLLLIVPALAFVVLRTVVRSERVSWLIAGWLFAATVAASFGARPLGALVAGPAMLAGANAGEWAWRTLARPSPRAVAAALALGIAVPLATGVVDLVLRAKTA